MRPSGFAILRSALLPFEILEQWGEGLESTWSENGPDHGDRLERNRDLLIARLRALVSRDEIQEGIRLASPSTYSSLRRWLDTAVCPDEKLVRTLTRYIERMAGRATPFGLFAGCSVVRVADHTRIKLAPLAEYRRKIRVDNEFVLQITDFL